MYALKLNWLTFISILHRVTFCNIFSTPTTVLVELTNKTFSGPAPINETDLFSVITSL